MIKPKKTLKTDNRKRQFAKKIPLNDFIPHSEFTVIDETGKNLGLMIKKNALALAESKELDLLCIRSTPDPLCKILNYGKFKFLKNKKSKKGKKNLQKTTKEMRITAQISERDLEIKIKKIQKFLQESKKVKITMRLRGRELAKLNYGKDKLDFVINKLKTDSELIAPPKLTNRTYNMFLIPLSNKKKIKNEKSQNENQKISPEKTEEDSKQ